ncbi:protein PTST homolog 3, chloroplastic-like [Coffea eugenioides]|uniref:protein PTST homolog 3, chloroplastic-like n=1 Tax=Coffea eugenioides TaxID=49369 RepID=UPI000F610D0A|nr:protein PTST homolog 3, chloroplastic-like [Coffea eugenioides]XP_027173783.1 protein PTST homolog 3, chloroplastic-like [Coffea eugenioides]
MLAMSALCSRFPPVFHSLTSYKLSSLPNHNYLPAYPHRNRLRTWASVSKKPRGSRRVKSNEDLYNDIREFLSAVGLPHDHVPSMKQLSEHGRQDLANIVRRRGYKFIRELLTRSAEMQINISITEEKLTGGQHIPSGGEGHHEKVKDSCEDTSLLSEANEIKEHEKSLVEDAQTNTGLDSDKDDSCSPESSIYPSLQDKVAKFIQDGELDDVEDSGFDILNERTSQDSTAIAQSPYAIESNSISVLGQQNDPVLNSADTVNGNMASSSHQVEHRVLETSSSRIESHSSEEVNIIDFKEDQEIEAQNLGNQAEINHLKFILHQKELELTQLKEEIEKEKVALSILQTKADKEIIKAQKLILEKDAELQAAEESLSELKEVEIQYWGEGEVVEVAGSFNGWHQKIKMDSQPSSSLSDPNGSRKSRLWRSVLWLYPGVYEIKFIVDGHWTVDPQRESVTRDIMHNNILRVVR